MEWFDFLALMLASGAVLEAWFKGDAFASLRAAMQSKSTTFWQKPLPRLALSSEAAAAGLDEEDVSQPRWLQILDRWVPDAVGAALSCTFCSSYHAPFWIGLICWVPSLWLPEPWNALVKFPIYALAATRAGNIATGMLPAKLHYESNDDDDD